MPGEESMRSRLRGLPRSAWVIFAGMFLVKFGNFLNVFLMLFLVAQGFSAFQAGVALGMVGVGAFIGNAVGGTVADRYGRRTAIVVSMFGSSTATACVPFTDGLVSTTALVTLVGVFAQLYRPAAGALLVDVVPEQQRVVAFAVLRLAINVGMAVGPLVGALLSDHSYTYVFLGDALFAFSFGVLALFTLPGGLPKPGPAADGEGLAERPKGGYREVFADRPYLLFLGSMVAATFVYGQSTVTLPLHVKDAGFGNSVYGLLLGLNALLCIVIELPLTKRTERRDPRRVIALGLLLLGVGMALTGAAHVVWFLALTVVVWTVAETVYTPIANAYPAEFSPAHLRGRYQGAEGLAHTLGASLGPAVGGLLYGMSAPLHWVVCAVVASFGALLVLGAKPRGTARDTETVPAADPVAGAPGVEAPGAGAAAQPAAAK